MPDGIWPILGIGAVIIAGVFAVFVPRSADVYTLRGLTFIIVRWFHSGVWVLLALSFFMRTLSNEAIKAWANPVAMLGGIGYLIYIVTLLNALKS